MSMYGRLGRAVALVLGVFIYGTIGHFILLFPRVPLLDCAFRTIVLLGTINEAFSAEQVGVLNVPVYRVFTLTLIIFGVSVILYALSTITAFLVEGELQELMRIRKMSKEIAKFRNHFIIAGGGETGHYIADELRVSKRQFVMIENNKERVQRLADEGHAHVEGDAADEHILEQAGIHRATGLAVALPSDPQNLFVTITARQMNPDLMIIAKGIEGNINSKLIAAGADKVVRPAFIGGMRMASELIRPTAVTFIDRMLRDPTDTTRIEEIVVTAGGNLEGHTIANSKFRQKTGLQVVAIRRPGEDKFCYQPDVEAILEAGTSLVVIGLTEDVAKARELAGPD